MQAFTASARTGRVFIRTIASSGQGPDRLKRGGPAKPSPGRDYLSAQRKKKLASDKSSPPSPSANGPSASEPTEPEPTPTNAASDAENSPENSPEDSHPEPEEDQPLLPEDSSAPHAEPAPKPQALLPTPEDSSVSETPWHNPGTSAEAAALKNRLLRLVASLDRGLSATRGAKEEVDAITRQLERKWDTIDLMTNPFPLAGKWRLIYSSAFSGGSLGGSRPGPAANLVPFTLGQVYQRIQVGRVNLSNIVELIIGAPSTPFPFQSLGLEPLILQINLGHEFEQIDAKTTRIVYNATTVRTRGGPQGVFKNVPPFSAPELPEFLRPPPQFRSATFSTSYVDEDFRVSRGDRGELRVYVKAE